jgi:hypothetical protein
VGAQLVRPSPAGLAGTQELQWESLNKDCCSVSSRAAALKLHPLRLRGLCCKAWAFQGSGMARRLLLVTWVGPMPWGFAATGCCKAAGTAGASPKASSSTRLTRRRPAAGPLNARDCLLGKQQQHSLLSILQPLPEMCRRAGPATGAVWATAAQIALSWYPRMSRKQLQVAEPLPACMLHNSDGRSCLWM